MKRKQRKFVPYQEYIHSEEWRSRKAHWIRLFGDRCICGRTGTELHHRHYINLGSEPPHQLILLCNSCHQRVHGHPKAHTTDKRQLRINLRRLLRQFRSEPPPTGTYSGGVLKT